MKKEFYLDGLCCAGCAAKIEKTVAGLPQVCNVSLNFATTSLAFELTDQKSATETENEIRKIISRIEPDVIIKEITINADKKHTLMLVGLCCSNCANKIESKVRNIAGVKHAVLDFTNQKLSVEIAGFTDSAAVTGEIVELVRQIEPDVKVISEETQAVQILKTESRSLQKKMSLAAAAAGLLFFLTGYLSENPQFSTTAFLAAYLLIGYSVLLRAIKNILRGELFDEHFLMSLATIGAIAIREFPEAVTVMLFYQIGEYLQGRAVNKSRQAITELLNLKPATGTVLRNEQEIKLPPEEIRVDDILIIRPGEKIALDGIVSEGSSLIDASALTGESLPYEVTIGQEILAGCINRRSLLKLKVSRPYNQSAIAKIIEQVQNAAQNKASTELFITRFAKMYTPAVVLIAALIAFLPPLLVAGAGFHDWIYRALVFLVVSCPCALVLSIPLGFFGGIGAASRAGILVKGGNYLEALNKVKTVVLDKTGTLTRGIFKITSIQTAGNISKEEILMYAAAAEFYSNHPVALSVSKEYSGMINREDISFNEEIAGMGTITIWQNKKIICGNQKLMTEQQVVFTPAREAGTILYLAADGLYAGYILISDELKKDAKSSVAKLKQMGIKVCMLTGDNQKIAADIAAQTGIEEFYAGLLPLDKVQKLEEMQLSNPAAKVAFAGDGLNDAPVLARADVGIAMGGFGSDAAIEAADVVIMTDEPLKIVTALEIAAFTQKIVWQNISWAFAIKAAVLILGAYGAATMWEAIFADVGVALLAVMNALRLIRKRF